MGGRANNNFLHRINERKLKLFILLMINLKILGVDYYLWKSYYLYIWYIKIFEFVWKDLVIEFNNLTLVWNGLIWKFKSKNMTFELCVLTYD